MRFFVYLKKLRVFMEIFFTLIFYWRDFYPRNPPVLEFISKIFDLEFDLKISIPKIRSKNSTIKSDPKFQSLKSDPKNSVRSLDPGFIPKNLS